MNFPQNCKYAKSHEWLRVENNVAFIGVSDFAQSELGDVVFVDITAHVGDVLHAGDVFGTIEAVKTVSDLYLPVSGRLLEVNPIVIDDPAKINSDPYGAGWMIRIELTDPAESIGLLDAPTYAAMVGQTA